MLAEAFASVRFPILPLITEHKEKGLQLHQRNPSLFTPQDFDYSPYFEIIKYPIFELSEHMIYKNLPWSEEVPDHLEARPEGKPPIKKPPKDSDSAAY